RREAFLSSLTARLKAVIDEHIAAVGGQERDPDFALQAGHRVHQNFAAERLRGFVGRETNRSAIAAYIDGAARHPLVVRGVSRSGKSGVMGGAGADREAMASAKVVKRFVGASAASADQRALLISLVEDLAAHGVLAKPAEWADDANRLVGQVRDLIA